MSPNFIVDSLTHGMMKAQLKDARVGARPPGIVWQAAQCRSNGAVCALASEVCGSRHAWLEGQGALDLIVTMDDATGAIYSAFLVAEEARPRPSGR
jgi:hypothetical protein